MKAKSESSVVSANGVTVPDLFEELKFVEVEDIPGSHEDSVYS